MVNAFVAVNSAGYFNDAAIMLSVRDLMIVVDSYTPMKNLSRSCPIQGLRSMCLTEPLSRKPIGTSGRRAAYGSHPFPFDRRCKVNVMMPYLQ